MGLGIGNEILVVNPNIQFIESATNIFLWWESTYS